MDSPGVPYLPSLLSVLWGGLNGTLGTPTITLRLFTDDRTPQSSDDPFTYQEASGPNYAPLVLNASQGGINPRLNFWQYLDIEGFASVGPLTPGNDTVFGWWLTAVYSEVLYVALYGARFDQPLVLNMAGQGIVFDTIQLGMGGSDTPLVASSLIADPWFQSPPVTGTPPNNYAFNAVGGYWQYPVVAGGLSGICGQGSAYGPPNPVPGAFQCALIQGPGVIQQVLYLLAGVYQLNVLAANRGALGSAVVAVSVGDDTVGTISAWPTNWQLWQSSNFTIPSSDTYAITFTGVDPLLLDQTLFLQICDLIPIGVPVVA